MLSFCGMQAILTPSAHERPPKAPSTCFKSLFSRCYAWPLCSVQSPWLRNSNYGLRLGQLCASKLTLGEPTYELRCLCMRFCCTCELRLQERLRVALVELGHKHASLLAPCLQISQMSPLKAAKLPFPRSALPALPEGLAPADASQPAMQFV